MKKFIVLTILVLAGVFGASAQNTQSPNEFQVNLNFLRQDVKLVKPVVKFNENTDSFGVGAGYTRYFGAVGNQVGVIGLTGEVAANFDSKEASLVTVLGGLQAKARNSGYVQPYVRAMAGVGVQHVNRHNILNPTDASVAYDLGAGLDFKFSKNGRNGFGLGVDYLNTGYHGERDNGVRVSTRFVF